MNVKAIMVSEEVICKSMMPLVWTVLKKGSWLRSRPLPSLIVTGMSVAMLCTSLGPIKCGFDVMHNQ